MIVYQGTCGAFKKWDCTERTIIRPNINKYIKVFVV